jgi:hypothetical protein
MKKTAKKAATKFVEKQSVAARVAKAREIIAKIAPAARTARSTKPTGRKVVPVQSKPAQKPVARSTAAVKTSLAARKARPAKPADVSTDVAVADAIQEPVARKKSAKTEAATPKERDVPFIEARMTVGGITYPVDASDLARTIGAGSWVGKGFVDAWPDAAWVGILAHLELPADPLDRTVAAQPVKRFVQRAWYAAIDPKMLEERKQTFDERDEARKAEYKEKFAEVKEEKTEKAVRARVSFGKARGGDGSATKYTPTDALKAKKLVLGGQAGILLKAFRDAGFVPMTTEEATAAMLKAGLKTSTDPKRIAAFYLSQWSTKRGYLTR